MDQGEEGENFFKGLRAHTFGFFDTVKIIDTERASQIAVGGDVAGNKIKCLGNFNYASFWVLASQFHIVQFISDCQVFYDRNHISKSFYFL